MRTKNAVFLLALLFVCYLGSSQGTEIYLHPQKKFQDALGLFNNKQYQAAQTLFEEVLAFVQMDIERAQGPRDVKMRQKVIVHGFVPTIAPLFASDSSLW